MPALAAVLLLLATGGPEFHSPTAEWRVDTVVVTVGLSGSDGPVIAHLVLAGEPERVIPMIQGDDGSWEAAVEVRPADWRVVFEDLASGHLSAPQALSQLGAGSSVVVSTTVPVAEEASGLPVTAALLTVGGVLVVAGGAALAGRRRLAPRHRAVTRRGRRLRTRIRRSAPN